MPGAADLNAGVARGRRAAERRAGRLEEAHAAAIARLGREVAAALRTLTAAVGDWTGPPPSTLTDELRRRFDARYLAWVDRDAEPVRVEAVRAAAGPMFAAVGLSLDLNNPLLRGALLTLGNRTDLSATAWAGVRESLQASYDAGESVPNASRRLARDVAAVAPRRARVIVRTELAQGVNAGSMAAARASRAAPYKQWLATADARTRNSHRAAAGQVRALDDTFSVGGYDLDYPGDPRGPAGEVIHCRCTLLYADGPEGYGGELGPAAMLASSLCACGVDTAHAVA